MRDSSAPDSIGTVPSPSFAVSHDDAITPEAAHRLRPRPSIARPAIGLGAIALLIGLGWVVLATNGPRQVTSATPQASPPALAAPGRPVVKAPAWPVATAPTSPMETPPSSGAASTTAPAPPVAAAAPPPASLIEDLMERSPPHVGAPTNLPREIAAAPSVTPPAPAAEPAPSMDRYEVTVRVEKGDTLEKLLAELDFAPSEIEKAIDALRLALRGPKPVEGKGKKAKAIHAKQLASWRAPIRLPIGEAVEVTVGTPKQAGGMPILLDLSIRPTVTREIALHRLDNGDFNAQEKTYKVTTKVMRASGVVKGSLRASAAAAGVPPAAMYEALRAFAYDLDLQRDVKNGDHFTVLLEQAFTSDGRQVGSGRVKWAELKLSGKRIASVHRFRPKGGADQFWLSNGQSVVKSLIRTPMDLRRVSSRFGMRSHPILGFSSMHTGTDFAAPYGTPVIAAGNGVVKQAGPYGGYGNWVLIAHDSRISTGYAHLARFAPGIRPGARVRQGQVVGFVGSTGLSTGPHLHYELHSYGRPVNPITHRAAVRGALHGTDLQHFRAQVARTNRERNAAPVLVARNDSDSGDAVRATVTPVRSRSRLPAARAIKLAYLVDSVEMPNLSPSPPPRAKPSNVRAVTQKSRTGIKKRSGIGSGKTVKSRGVVKKRSGVKARATGARKPVAKSHKLVAQRHDGKARRSGSRRKR